MQTLYLKLNLKISHWFRENYCYDTNKEHQRHQNCPSAFDRAALYRVFARITTLHMYRGSMRVLLKWLQAPPSLFMTQTGELKHWNIPGSKQSGR
jgi:hypothetical protein